MKVVRTLNNSRLALFSIAYGLSGALIGGTLNRIMIAELGLPATLVAFFFAIPLLVSPVRVWLGYRSDGYPIFGKRREPYIIFGAFGNCAFTFERFIIFHAVRTGTQPGAQYLSGIGLRPLHRHNPHTRHYIL